MKKSFIEDNLIEQQALSVWNYWFSRYSSGQQLEADESTNLLFLPVSVIKQWNFLKSVSAEESITSCREEQKTDEKSLPHTFKEIYNEMTGGCKGGLRLLHFYLNHFDSC